MLGGNNTLLIVLKYELLKISIQGEQSSLLNNRQSSSRTYSHGLSASSPPASNNFVPHTYVRGIIVLLVQLLEFFCVLTLMQ